MQVWASQKRVSLECLYNGHIQDFLGFQVTAAKVVNKPFLFYIAQILYFTELKSSEDFVKIDGRKGKFQN